MKSTVIKLSELKAETTILIPGPAGALELLGSPALEQSKGLALICHPHPLHGGTMSNKVVTTLSKTFQQRGLQTLRFNFRGVGQSEGAYAEGEGELADLLAVCAWVKAQAPEQALSLAGFSFGAYIALRAAALDLQFKTLITVAPPINHFPLSPSFSIRCPWIIAQGEQDDIVPTPEVLEWVATLNPQPTVMLFPDTGHFFHGHLTALKERLLEMLEKFESGAC